MLIFLGTVISFWISAICGGGASLVLIPLLNLNMASTQVPAALTVGTFASSSSRLMVFWKNISWNIVKYYVPAAIPTVWIGAWALKYFNPIYLQFFVGIFLLVNVRHLLMPKSKIRQDESPSTNKVLMIIGALAGFISGLTGAVGLLFNRFYLKYGLTKEQIVATRAANDIIIHLIKLILYSIMGLLTMESLKIGLIIAVGAIVSSFSVKYILPLLSETVFRRIGYGAMAVSGMILLINTSASIIMSDHPSVHFMPMGNTLETQFAWRSSHVAIELEYESGIEIEHSIAYTDLPDRLIPKVDSLIRQAEHVMYEQVNSFQGTTYEVYITSNGELRKYDLN